MARWEIIITTRRRPRPKIAPPTADACYGFAAGRSAPDTPTPIEVNEVPQFLMRWRYRGQPSSVPGAPRIDVAQFVACLGLAAADDVWLPRYRRSTDELVTTGAVAQPRLIIFIAQKNAA